MINKPTDIKLQNLFDKVELPLGRADLKDIPVFHGGPVQTERGFVLHEALLNMPTPAEGEDPPEPVYASTMMIPGGLEMTTSRDVLEALSTGAGPARVLVSLGYSAWAQGQLESEIGENSWLIVHADPAVIFETPVAQRYDKALSLLGLQAWMLSPQAGHA
jgi:putative transcriptional regulator